MTTCSLTIPSIRRTATMLQPGLSVPGDRAGNTERGALIMIARVTRSGVRLCDGFVMATAGTDPPWPPLLKGGKLAH